MNVWEMHEQILNEIVAMENKIREMAGKQIEDPLASSYNRGLVSATLAIKNELIRAFTAFRNQPENAPVESPPSEDPTDEALRNVNPRDERKQ